MDNSTLQCTDLMKSFGGLRVIRGVTVHLKPGKVTAFVGPNGAGKSTLFHLLTGFLSVDHGEIWYRQRRIDGMVAHRIARLGIGRLFQDVRVFENLTVLENVLVAFPMQTGENPAWSFVRPDLVQREEATRSVLAKSWLETVGLDVDTKSPAGELSHGQRKLLAIARLLAFGSDVLLLDEPTSGVSPVIVGSLTRLVRKLAAEGKTVAVIEHNMDVVLECADYVYFMDAGKVAAFGSPDEVLGNPAIRATYLGL